MRLRTKALIVMFLLVPTALWAQIEDFGIWASIGANKDFGKFNVASETELRTQENSSEVDRWSWGLETSYQIFKPLKVGVSYEFIYFNDVKYADYQPRHRGNLFLQGKQKFGNFTFTLREKVQVTNKDESDRIKKSGKINTYKINPEWTWRNKFKVAYDIPKFPVTPSLSVETFYQLNNPDGNVFDKLRYNLSLSYHINKHNDIELYGLIDKDINVDDPVTMYVLGVGYNYSF